MALFFGSSLFFFTFIRQRFPKKLKLFLLSPCHFLALVLPRSLSVLLSNFPVLVSVSLMFIQAWPVAVGQHTGLGGDSSLWKVSLPLRSLFFFGHSLKKDLICFCSIHAVTLRVFIVGDTSLLTVIFVPGKRNTTHSGPPSVTDEENTLFQKHVFGSVLILWAIWKSILF